MCQNLSYLLIDFPVSTICVAGLTIHSSIIFRIAGHLDSQSIQNFLKIYNQSSIGFCVLSICMDMFFDVAVLQVVLVLLNDKL